MTLEFLGIAISVFSILFAAATYFADKMLARRDKTISAITELLKEYRDGVSRLDISGHYHEHVAFLSRVEHFAISVREGVYSHRVVKKYASHFLKMLYGKYKTALIDQRRKQFKRKSYYEYFEKMVKGFGESN